MSTKVNLTLVAINVEHLSTILETLKGEYETFQVRPHDPTVGGKKPPLPTAAPNPAPPPPRVANQHTFKHDKAYTDSMIIDRVYDGIEKNPRIIEGLRRVRGISTPEISRLIGVDPRSSAIWFALNRLVKEGKLILLEERGFRKACMWRFADVLDVNLGE